MDEFIRENIVKKENHEITQDEVYARYLRYCEAINIKPLNKVWFGRSMNVFDFSTKQIGNNTRIYHGLGLNECKY
ncbi:primase-like DNA-binding domain-containing protein [Psychrobacillus sp. FSL H8-0487]|uniref:primase-like DNA-binding domain-containing protein n=1 Tax=Psychrobacillus sp. FSL H8-0487 TaxID=2921391 RepID=UPI0030F82F10